jgi:hypothetical protein
VAEPISISLNLTSVQMPAMLQTHDVVVNDKVYVLLSLRLCQLEYVFAGIFTTVVMYNPRVNANIQRNPIKSFLFSS